MIVLKKGTNHTAVNPDRLCGNDKIWGNCRIFLIFLIPVKTGIQYFQALPGFPIKLGMRNLRLLFIPAQPAEG